MNIQKYFLTFILLLTSFSIVEVYAQIHDNGVNTTPKHLEMVSEGFEHRTTRPECRNINWTDENATSSFVTSNIDMFCNDIGDSILHTAVREMAPLSALEVLIVKGADVWATNELGETPLRLLMESPPADEEYKEPIRDYLSERMFFMRHEER